MTDRARHLVEGMRDDTPAGVARVDLKGILAVLSRRRWLLVATVLAGTVLGVLAGRLLPPVYTATAEVVVDPRESRVLQTEAVAEALPREPDTVATQIGVIRSRSLVRDVVLGLDLQADPELNSHLGSPEAAGLSLTGWLQERVRQVADWLPVRSGLAAGPERPPSPEAQIEAATDSVLERLEVAQQGYSFIISIRFSSGDPDKAARVANALAERYVDGQRARKLEATDRAAGWLSERLEDLRERAQAAERAIEAYRARHRITDALGVDVDDQELAELNQRLVTARAERAEREAKLELVQALRARGGGFESLAEVLASPVIVELRTQEAALVRQEGQLRGELGERHPRIVELRAERSDLADRIAREVANIVRSLENEVEVARTRERSFAQSYERARAERAHERQATLQLRQLEREADAARALYTAFLNRYNETSEQREIVEGDARLISVAAVPERPSFPRPRLFAIAGFTASLFAGALLAFVRERLDTTLHSRRQVEAALGLPCLGFVPKAAVGRSPPHRYLLERPLSSYAEALRTARMALCDKDGGARTVLVTSALPGEGKTSFALSLAASAAKARRRTVVVDLDLRRPAAARLLEGPPGPGIVEFLAGECDIGAVLHTDTGVPGLHLIPVNRRAASPADLLASGSLRRLVRALAGAYELVVLDTTPTLGLADAAAAATLADKVVLVAEWGWTTAEVAAEAVDLLREAKAPLVGCILTRVDLRRHARGAYDGAGRYYRRFKPYYRD